MRTYLLNRPQLDMNAFADFLQDELSGWHEDRHAHDAELITEIAGRICYMSFGDRQSKKSNTKYIRSLIEAGHESVLEHVHWTFLVSGVSRSFTHQLVRHRVGFSFSQLSQQYCEHSGARFIRPDLVKRIPYLSMAWDNAIEKTKEAYREILENLRKVEKNIFDEAEKAEIKRAIFSAARSVLPNATETKILVTANARALRHFLKVRGSLLGDEEMRVSSAEWLALLQAEAPALFFDFQIDTASDGLPIVIHNHSELSKK